jgi:hypothetical protein
LQEDSAVPITPETIYDHLTHLPQRRSLDAALELFDALGYQYADELPLPIRNWPAGIRRLLRGNAEPPTYLAQHRDFRVVYTHLTTDYLSRTVERPIVEQTLHKLNPYALFVFANRDRTLWDFVNVKYVAEDGARRRTIRRIHVGPTERLHTAAQRLSLLAVPSPDTSALELQSLHDQAFDVEEVTKQFYQDYVQVFDALCKDIARRNPGRQAEAETEAQVLLDRLMFLYFIQKKGWLDDQRDYLYQHFQAYYRADPKGTDFYSDFLFPLFVALSNESTGLPSLGEIPFLNGGLFEVPADTSLTDQLLVGNAVFHFVFDDLLERYNFTVREDTPLDIEVAIDPEMLGQVFENLVLGLERGEDRRKATGSYYTPRVIVHFMCRQALKEYLAAESGLDPACLEALMDVGPAEQLTPEEVAELTERITEPQARLLRGLVEGARVLDPAVGSGAFLVGMLYEMVALTKLLDVRLQGQKRVQRRNYDYDLKRGFIERNLYGVDIQPEAARICELRLWLSLMVDYERRDREAVPTLPNLSYRVRVGDSLIERLFDEPVQLDQLADDAVARQLIDRIQTEKQAYFKEPTLAEKERRELRILGLLCELAAKLVGAKRGAVLTQMSAEVPGLFDAFGEGLLTKKQLQAKREAEAELARYDALMEQVKGVYEQVQDIQTGEASAEARDVGALRAQLGLSFIWRLDFAEVFADQGGFDVVIANPPYIKIQTMMRWSPDAAQRCKELYRSAASGNYDVYVVFVEKGLELLKPSGAFVYILPHKFFQARFGRGLRALIADQGALCGVISFGWNQIFEESTTYTCLLFLGQNRSGSFKYALIEEVDELGQQLHIIATTDEMLSHKLKVGSVPLATVNADEWNFAVGAEAQLLDRIQSVGIPLGDLTRKIFVGLQTSADRIYFLERLGPDHEGVVRVKSKSLGREVEIERGLLKPLLRGSDIHRYSVKEFSEYVLFPYEIDGAQANLMSERTLRRKYPLGWKYLLENRKAIEGREKGRMKGPGWYGYIYPKNLTEFEQAKIMTPDIAYGCQMGYDDTRQMYHTTTVYSFAFKPEVRINPMYFLGVMNSKIMAFFLRMTGTVLRGGYTRFKTAYLSPFPMRTINFDNPTDVARHDKMVALVERMLALHKQFQSADEADRADLERQIAETDAEVDALVYELYGLTEGEMAIVEGRNH